MFFSTGICSCRDFCDNKLVFNNSSIPTSVLNGIHNDIYYHRVREAQASGALRVGWIQVEFNLIDLFTKTMMPRNTRHNFVGQYSRTQHHQLVVLRGCRFICTLVHLSTSHTTRVVV